MAKRTVEYYRLWEDHTWDTDFIKVEDQENLDEAIVVAAEHIDWKDGAPVIVGLYNSMDDQEDEDDSRAELLAEMKAELRDLELIFDAQGGRGVELADQIDALRAEIEELEGNDD